MAKPIPKIGSRKTRRLSSRKSGRRIPKGVIHVQASFNNTIVTVTYVRGRVVSWSSAGIHATQPKKDNGELAEISTKYFSRDLLQITGMAIKIVSINMQVLDPRGSIRALS